MKKLIQIQTQLKAPKSQHNKFGNYNYRSAEDILESLKPLLAEHECTLLLTDDIIEVAGRIYVKATANFTDGTDKATVTAYAREEETKKGMDASQITGAASSYARKYALNGLFLIDDTKDADATNKHGKDEAETTPAPIQPPAKEKPELVESSKAYHDVVQWIKAGGTDEEREKLFQSVYNKYTVSEAVKQSVLIAAKAQRQKDEPAISN